MAQRRRSLRAGEVNASKLDYANVKFLVESQLPPGLLNVWKELLLQNPKIKKLWGKEQPGGFARKMITLCIYKDLTGFGFEKVLKSVNIGFQLKLKSFAHNCKLLRKLLFDWARQQIHLDGKDVWNDMAAILPNKVGLEKVNLMMDSSDFRLSGKTSASRKDANWSFKCNGPGQRFQILIDAKGRVQKVWGGYSPKLYDGDWIKIAGEVLIDHCDGAHIIADTHYETANRTLKLLRTEPNVVFYTPIAKPRGKKRKRSESDLTDPSLGVAVLTKEQEAWNARIAHVRSRVESPFGLIKNKWKSLGGVFFEGEEQQNYLVYIAFAVHNLTINANSE
jgi:hypothetical protein